MGQYNVHASVIVSISINDDDVIERVTGPEGDEFRASLYDLHTEEDVLAHLAFNCVQNGRRDFAMLDGWADLTREAGTMYIDDVWVDNVERVA